MPSSRDKHTYIPPHVQQAMSQHMNQTMPAHLKKYQSSSGYIPQHVEKAMAQHMQKTLPSSMKQYAGAYMEQNVVSQHVGVTPQAGAAASPSFMHQPQAVAPVNYASPQQAFQPVSGQPSVQQPTSTQYPAQPQVPPQGSSYDFIMNPTVAHKQPFTLPGTGGNPLLARVAVVSGGIIAVIIILSIAKSLFGGSGDLTPVIATAQDQQAIISLIGVQTSDQGTLSTSSQDFAATAKLSLSSSQSQTITYLASNKKKLPPKVLNLKVKTADTTQLAATAAAGTYDITFQELMRSKLSTYSSDLSTAYDHMTGKKGRALLKDEFDQAQLLLNQLPSTSSSGN